MSVSASWNSSLSTHEVGGKGCGVGNVSKERLRGRGVARCVAIVTCKDGQYPIRGIENRECLGLHQKHNFKNV